MHWVKCKFNFSCSLVFSTFFSFYSIPFLFYHCHFKLLMYLPDYTDDYFLMTFFMFLAYITFFQVFFFSSLFILVCVSRWRLSSSVWWFFGLYLNEALKKMMWGSVSISYLLTYFILESFGSWRTSSLRTKIFFSGQFSAFREVIFHFLCVKDAGSQLLAFDEIEDARGRVLWLSTWTFN